MQNDDSVKRESTERPRYCITSTEAFVQLDDDVDDDDDDIIEVNKCNQNRDNRRERRMEILDKNITIRVQEWT